MEGLTWPEEKGLSPTRETSEKEKKTLATASFNEHGRCKEEAYR